MVFWVCIAEKRFFFYLPLEEKLAGKYENIQNHVNSLKPKSSGVRPSGYLTTTSSENLTHCKGALLSVAFLTSSIRRAEKIEIECLVNKISWFKSPAEPFTVYYYISEAVATLYVISVDYYY